MRFSEEYKRYYYRDIQALQLRGGARWWCQSWLIGILLTLAVASLVFSVARRFTWAGACEVTMFASLGLIAYQSLARGCFCYIVTAVATEELVWHPQLSDCAQDDGRHCGSRHRRAGSSG